MRHVITDHSVLHAFLVADVEVLEDNGANRLDGRPAIARQGRKILFDGRGFALHVMRSIPEAAALTETLEQQIEGFRLRTLP